MAVHGHLCLPLVVSLGQLLFRHVTHAYDRIV